MMLAMPPRRLCGRPAVLCVAAHQLRHVKHTHGACPVRCCMQPHLTRQCRKWVGPASCPWGRRCVGTLHAGECKDIYVRPGLLSQLKAGPGANLQRDSGHLAAGICPLGASPAVHCAATHAITCLTAKGFSCRTAHMHASLTQSIYASNARAAACGRPTRPAAQGTSTSQAVVAPCMQCAGYAQKSAHCPVAGKIGQSAG